MIKFEIFKKSKKSRARLGLLETSNGTIETPSLVPVATQASIKTLTSEEAERAGCQILICNTFHLHLRPGEKIIKNTGGLHKFMNWKRPLMTDSGGFQVFSLGFGHDLGVGKVVKYFPSDKKEKIKEGAQPKRVKITNKGVDFQSPIDGKKLFLGPKESIKIQERLGADIIFAFDECTPPFSTKDYVKKSLERTHEWAKICIENKKSTQALFGITQGSNFKDLREGGAKHINSLGFDGFGIGGDLGITKKDSVNILKWTIPHLDEKKPRHLLGIGKLEDIEMIIKEGVDLFDCTVPTHYARRGIAFIHPAEKINLSQSKFLKDKKPPDPKCSCETCQKYTRSYICHLLRANEITAMKLITFHNLYFFNNFIARVREKIKNDKI